MVLVGQVFTAGAVYGGIRSDIRHSHAKAEAAQKSADQAHQRIDDVLLKGH